MPTDLTPKITDREARILRDLYQGSNLSMDQVRAFTDRRGR